MIANKEETIPNLAMRSRQLSAQELCSEVIIDSLSSFPEGTVFTCWDLQMAKLGSIKVPVVRHDRGQQDQEYQVRMALSPVQVHI